MLGTVLTKRTNSLIIAPIASVRHLYPNDLLNGINHFYRTPVLIGAILVHPAKRARSDQSAFRHAEVRASAMRCSSATWSCIRIHWKLD